MPQELRVISALLTEALLPYTSGSRPGEIGPPSGHLAITGDVYGKRQTAGVERESPVGEIDPTTVAGEGKKVD